MEENVQLDFDHYMSLRIGVDIRTKPRQTTNMPITVRLLDLKIYVQIANKQDNARQSI